MTSHASRFSLDLELRARSALLHPVQSLRLYLPALGWQRQNAVRDILVVAFLLMGGTS
jgi:hypothetical protein